MAGPGSLDDGAVRPLERAFSGEVAVTLGAVGEGMVAGDAVNTAARVQAAAGPGSVLVDGATQRLAAAGVGFADAGEHHLAHGLLDHAEHLLRTGDDQAAEAAIAEARDIAGRLPCQPLLGRAANLTPARPPAPA